MTVFLGHYGRVELQRRMPRTQITILTIDPGRRAFTARGTTNNLSGTRFYGMFTTGDRLEFNATTNLTWISGITSETPGGNTRPYFIHVDQIGAIRLYENLADSLAGELANAVQLTSTNNDNTVNMTVNINYVDTTYNPLAQVRSYELNTTKETIDGTALSEEFRTQYAGLMSGSGRLSCLWDYTNIGQVGNRETINYLLQLVNRTQVGSEFGARLYLKTDTYNPSKNTNTQNDLLYYEVNAVITNAAVAFQPDSIVEAQIEFVTTGQISLRIETVPFQRVQVTAGVNLGLGQGQNALANPA